MNRFTDRVALITGAASGVGRATARQMVGEGASVYGVDIDQEGLQSVADELGERFSQRPPISETERLVTKRLKVVLNTLGNSTLSRTSQELSDLTM